VRAVQVASAYRPRLKALSGRPLRVIRESSDTVLLGTQPLAPRGRRVKARGGTRRRAGDLRPR
jgi:hypothetical protein